MNFFKKLFHRTEKKRPPNYFKAVRERKLSQGKHLPPIHFIFWHGNNPDKVFTDVEEFRKYCKSNKWELIGDN